MHSESLHEEQAAVPGNRSSLWSRFSSAQSTDEYWRAWLALQCTLSADTRQGVLVMAGEAPGQWQPVAAHPATGSNPGRLAELCERVIEEQCGLLLELDSEAGPDAGMEIRYGLAYPLLLDGRLTGVAALEVATREQGRLTAAMEQLQWGVCWLEVLLRRQQNGRDRVTLNRLHSSVDLLGGVLAEEHFDSACQAFVTQAATLLDCDRVSLGFRSGGHVAVRTISHSADFRKRMNLVQAIEAAMDEAIVQRRDIVYPPPAGQEPAVLRDHEQLSRQYQGGAILTLPLFGNDRYYGALTLERPGARPFSAEEVELVRSLAALAGPALEAKRLNDRLLVSKISAACLSELGKLLGPRFIGRKLLLLGAAALVLFLTLAQGDYRLSSTAVLEGAVRRVIVAPFDGYIGEAPARAGDVVAAGALLCTLDDRDLRLERLTLLSQKTQLQRQHQEAQAGHDRAQASIISAQLDQAEAQLRLAEANLERTRLQAPFAGVLVSGDLSQRLGGAVKQGEELYELTPLDAYRLIVQVDERRIADVRQGQRGSLRLSSLPETAFPFTIDKITPISTAEEGRNYFRVEARLEGTSANLRPGMEGVGKVFVDRRNLASIWTRNLVEWARLWFWSWWP